MTANHSDPSDRDGRLVDALLESPLLAGFARHELERIRESLSEESRAHGEWVFRRGQAGDALYVVLDGQVAIESPREGMPPLALCGPGDWFGELAVLTGRPRSADARVTVDANLLRIDREAWAKLSVRDPRVFAVLCERLGRALVETNEPPGRAGRTVVFCRPEAPWLEDLAASVRRQFPQRSVHVVRDEAARALAGIAEPDALILVTNDTRGEGLADRVLSRLGAQDWSLSPGAPKGGVQRVSGPDPERALARVARWVAGGSIGVALGAGGAFGLSHLGLLRVLEREGIPIDVVTGTSMGAIVGGAFAAGVPLARLEALAARLAKGYALLVLRDLDARGPALLTGRAVMRLLADLEPLGEARYEALDLPFRAVATDLGTGEAVIVERGPLLEGIRPSFAMPGIFPVCHREGRPLVDGAMASPVPVVEARGLGANFVVAVQPIPRLVRDVGVPKSSWRRIGRQALGLLPLWRLQHVLDGLDASLRSFQTLWHRLASEVAEQGDLWIEPDVGAYSFLQFGAAAALIEAGERAAEQALPALRARLAERIGWVGAG